MKEHIQHDSRGESKICLYEQTVQGKIKAHSPVHDSLSPELDLTSLFESCRLSFVSHLGSPIVNSNVGFVFPGRLEQGPDKMKIIHILFYDLNPHSILCLLNRCHIIPSKRLVESHDLSY